MKGKKILTWLLAVTMVLMLFPLSAFATYSKQWYQLSFTTNLLANGATRLTAATVIFINGSSKCPGVTDGKIDADQSSSWESHAIMAAASYVYAMDNVIETSNNYSYCAVVAWDDKGQIYVYANDDNGVFYNSPTPNKFTIEGCSYNSGSPKNGEWYAVKKYVATVATGNGGVVSSNAWSGNDGGWIANGTTATLTAQAFTGYYFTGWSDSNNSNPRTITAPTGSSATYTANFAQYQAKSDNTYYATVESAVGTVSTGTITANFADTLTPANGVSLKKDVALETKTGTFTAVDGAATISVAADGGVTLTAGRLKVARSNAKAVVTVVTNDKTVEVKIPANTGYTVDANEMPATVGKLNKDQSVEIGGITYTAGADETDFTIGDDTLTGAGDTATVPKSTEASITLGDSETVMSFDGENTASTVITRGGLVDEQETDTTVQLTDQADAFYINGKCYATNTKGATFVVNESEKTAYLKTGDGYIESGATLGVLNAASADADESVIVNVTAGGTGLGIVVEANAPSVGSATATVYEGMTMTVQYGEVTKTYSAAGGTATFVIDGGEDCDVALTSGATTLETDQGIYAGTTNKQIVNTGDKTITVSVDSKNTNTATLTVPAEGKVKVAPSGSANYYEAYEAVEEATIVVEESKNTIANGSVKLAYRKAISVRDVAIMNRYDEAGKDVIVSGRSDSVTIPEGGEADIGWAYITDVMQETIFALDTIEDATVSLNDGESVAINGVAYTGGEGGGSVKLDPDTGEVIEITGSINIKISVENLTEYFSYNMIPGTSVTIGKYVYTLSKEKAVLGDVTIKGRGADEDGTMLNPAIVLKDKAQEVDVALAANKDTGTTYTAANAATKFAISANDADTTKVDLLDNNAAANSALTFTGEDRHTVNGVAYSGLADGSSYTVTYATAQVDSGKTDAESGDPIMDTVNRNTVKVESGCKITAAMNIKDTININDSTVDGTSSDDKPFTASNSGVTILLDFSDTTSVAVSGVNSYLVPIKNDGDSTVAGYEVHKLYSGGVSVPVIDGDGTMNVKVSVSGSVATVSDITKTDLEKLGGDGNVTIDLSGLSGSVTGVKLPVSTLTNMLNSDVKKLEVKLPGADVTIDKTTLSALTEQTSADNLKLVVDDGTAARSTLNTAQTSTLSELNEPTVIEAYFASGDERISDFKGGTVSIAIELNTDRPIRVWYLKENGEREKVDASYDKETATLTLKHFSHYVIEQLDDSMGYASCPKGETCLLESFHDAVNTAWYHDGVHYCVENGLMKGYDDSKFGPDDEISRGQIVTILWRMEGSPAASGGNFDDVAADAYYANAVAWAAENGIVGGYGGGKFGPNDLITREQFAAILYRYAQFKGVDVSVGKDTNILDFDDAPDISSYAVPAIQWACGSGVITGTSATTLSPDGTATRAQAATMLMRYCAEVEK